MNLPKTKAIFFQIGDNKAKIQCICNQVREAMEREKRILIHVPNEEAAKYVDTLLWKTPEESFTPHVISNKPVKDRVVITDVEQNLNQADLLFNLKSTISPIFRLFEEIYEFYEESHPEKSLQAIMKMEKYSSKNVDVIKRQP